MSNLALFQVEWLGFECTLVKDKIYYWICPLGEYGPWFHIVSEQPVLAS